MSLTASLNNSKLTGYQKVFYIRGNLKKSGSVEAVLPYDELSYDSWQIGFSYLSVYNKDTVKVNKLILISTNFVKDYQINNLSERHPLNPPLVHLVCSVTSNSFASFPINHTLYNINTFAPSLIVYFYDPLTSKPVTDNLDIFLTVILKKNYC